MSFNNNNNNNNTIIKPGTIIRNHYRIQESLGSGSFGEIYSAVDLLNNNREVALKIERVNTKKTILKLEILALKHLQSCPKVVRYVHCGQCRIRDNHEIKFLAMEKLGHNLAQLRKDYGQGDTNKLRLSLSTTVRLGIQMIDCLEGVHRLGYVHRDIKPSNFVIDQLPTTTTVTTTTNAATIANDTANTRLNTQDTSSEDNHSEKNKNNSGSSGSKNVYIIDFGLARRYITASGVIRPARSVAGFRGTVRYASIGSHEQKELGPHDDMWSVFYSMVEFATGSLPWMRMKDKSQVLALKKQYNNDSLVSTLPNEFSLFMKHLQSLAYAQLPDYQYLRDLMKAICQENNYQLDDPYDWEMSDLRRNDMGQQQQHKPNQAISAKKQPKPALRSQPQLSPATTRSTATSKQVTSLPSRSTLYSSTTDKNTSQYPTPVWNNSHNSNQYHQQKVGYNRLGDGYVEDTDGELIQNKKCCCCVM